jgi:hypothetical protein
MELITINLDLSQTIAFFWGILFSIYIFLLGAVTGFRSEVNELLSEVFDASMSDEEKLNLGPSLVIPPIMSLILMGLTLILVNITALWIPFFLLALASLFTGFKRRQELKRKELADLGRTDL